MYLFVSIEEYICLPFWNTCILDTVSLCPNIVSRFFNPLKSTPKNQCCATVFATKIFLRISWSLSKKSLTRPAERTPKPEYPIARSQGSVGKVPFNFWWTLKIQRALKLYPSHPSRVGLALGRPIGPIWIWSRLYMRQFPLWSNKRLGKTGENISRWKRGYIFWGGNGKRHKIANWRGLEWFGFKVLIYYNLDFVYYIYISIYNYIYICISLYIHTQIYIYICKLFLNRIHHSALSIPNISNAPVLRWWRSAFLKNRWNLVLGKGLGILGVI